MPYKPMVSIHKNGENEFLDLHDVAKDAFLTNLA